MKIRQLCKKIFSRSIKSDLSYEEAVEIINRERVFIIDVRTPEEYNKRHFKNAINVPVYNIEKINELIKDKMLIEDYNYDYEDDMEKLNNYYKPE